MNIKILIIRHIFCTDNIITRIWRKEDKAIFFIYFIYAGFFTVVNREKIFFVRIFFDQCGGFFEPVLPAELIAPLIFKLFGKNTLFNQSGFVSCKQRHQMINMLIISVLKACFETDKNLLDFLL